LGFNILWWGTGIISLLAAIGFYFVTDPEFGKKTRNTKPIPPA